MKETQKVPRKRVEPEKPNESNSYGGAVVKNVVGKNHSANSGAWVKPLNTRNEIFKKQQQANKRKGD